MRKTRRSLLQIVACILLPLLLSSGALADQYRWSGVPRVVAISDPHGAYEAMVITLANAGIVDSELSWSGGDSHLVITGDLMDRGADSRKIMDLVMRLEEEALESGGMVHLTLGNHEVMNLAGDLRYVARAEFAAFADEESAEEREKWFERYREEAALQSIMMPDDEKLRAEFDEDRPPGFYGHREAFGSEGKYGRWLLQKPLIVVVNDVAYVHGGLPQMVADYNLENLNGEMQSQLRNYVRQLEVLQDAGLIDPVTNFYEHVKTVERLSENGNYPDAIRIAMQVVNDLNGASIHDSDGLVWYRGTVSCSILSEGDVLANALKALGANRLVIGHSPTITRQVLERFDGRVFEIDTGMLKKSYNGSGYALILEGDDISVVGESGTDPLTPQPHPRRVGTRSSTLSVEALEQLLSSGEIVSVSNDLFGSPLVKVTDGRRTVQAVFRKDPRRNGSDTERAAYLLDRLLRLDMVPVTVEREVDGKQGTLQFLPENTQTETERVNSGRGGNARCPLPRQWNSAYIFDALVYNSNRSPSTMVYNTSDWQLMLMGHQNAFGTKTSRPSYLRSIDLDITSTWVEALTSLSDQVLAEQLGEALDESRIAAIARRRDMLLSEANQ